MKLTTFYFITLLLTNSCMRDAKKVGAFCETVFTNEAVHSAKIEFFSVYDSSKESCEKSYLSNNKIKECKKGVQGLLKFFRDNTSAEMGLAEFKRSYCKIESDIEKECINGFDIFEEALSSNEMFYPNWKETILEALSSESEADVLEDDVQALKTACAYGQTMRKKAEKVQGTGTDDKLNASQIACKKHYVDKSRLSLVCESGAIVQGFLSHKDPTRVQKHLTDLLEKLDTEDTTGKHLLVKAIEYLTIF